MMYYFIYALWFVFLVVINQSRQQWTIFKAFKRKVLSSLISKANEPLINSSYYSFLTLFTYYFMHKMMSHIMFSLPRYFMCCLSG
jgi:membrane associated rhomboid family serine protease